MGFDRGGKVLKSLNGYRLDRFGDLEPHVGGRGVGLQSLKDLTAQLLRD